MKHNLLVSITLCFSVLFFGCSANEDRVLNDNKNNIIQENNLSAQETIVTEGKIEDPSNSKTAFGETFVLCEKTQFYELYKHSDGFAMIYKILNEHSEPIDYGYHENSISLSYNGDLLELSFSAGTFTKAVRYYDVHNSRVSRYYTSPLAVLGNTVVYTKSYTLVVQNIFDPTMYYQEFEMNPEPFSAVDFDVKFIDGQHIQVTYPISYEETFSTIYTLCVE